MDSMNVTRRALVVRTRFSQRRRSGSEATTQQRNRGGRLDTAERLDKRDDEQKATSELDGRGFGKLWMNGKRGSEFDERVSMNEMRAQ